MEKNHNLKSQFRREHKELKESKKSVFPPSKCKWFGYQLLLFLLQGTESRGSRNTDCEGAEAENEVIGIFVNIVFQRFVYKNVKHAQIYFLQTT